MSGRESEQQLERRLRDEARTCYAVLTDDDGVNVARVEFTLSDPDAAWGDTSWVRGGHLIVKCDSSEDPWERSTDLALDWAEEKWPGEDFDIVDIRAV